MAMNKTQKKALVREVMEDLHEAMAKLLPRELIKHWTSNPNVEAEALVLGLSETIENLAQEIDNLVFKAHVDSITPEDACTQAHEHIVQAIHRMFPDVEVVKRLWKVPRIGQLVELAAYQITLRDLLADLLRILKMIAPEDAGEEQPDSAPISLDSRRPNLNEDAS